MLLVTEIQCYNAANTLVKTENMLEIANLVGNSRKRIILLENSYLVRIHRIFGKVKVSTFTIERRMQEY